MSKLLLYGGTVITMDEENSRAEAVLIEDGIITYCKIIKGCRGNTEGLNRMVIGRKASEVADMLAGIPCRGDTSCPDQLSRAIRAYQQQA